LIIDETNNTTQPDHTVYHAFTQVTHFLPIKTQCLEPPLERLGKALYKAANFFFLFYMHTTAQIPKEYNEDALKINKLNVKKIKQHTRDFVKSMSMFELALMVILSSSVLCCLLSPGSASGVGTIGWKSAG
jgi:hypothetical protein